MKLCNDAADIVSADASRENSYDISILRLPHHATKWELVVKFLELRKSVFIDEMDWGLVHSDGIEFEQYDFIGAIYIIAHRDTEVLGGARLVRTDNAIGNGSVSYSYMIRDACLGFLPGMPHELCDKPAPVSPQIWELTRLVSTGDPGVAESILRASNRFLHLIGAQKCLFLGPPGFLRMAKKMGFDASPLGKIQGNKDGRFLAFSCDVLTPDTISRAQM